MEFEDFATSTFRKDLCFVCPFLIKDVDLIDRPCEYCAVDWKKYGIKIKVET